MISDFCFSVKLMSNDFSFGQDIHAFTHNHNANVKHIKETLKIVYRLHQVLLIYGKMYNIENELPTFEYADMYDCPFNSIDFEKIKEENDPNILHFVKKECMRSNDYYSSLWNYWQDLCKKIREMEHAHHLTELSNMRQMNEFLRSYASLIEDERFLDIVGNDDSD